MGDRMDVEATNVSHRQNQEDFQNIPAAVLNTQAAQQPGFRDIPVKVHIRRPDKDTWSYLGRGVASHEVSGQASRVVIRSASTNKVWTTFGEGSEVQAEKRGNFVVIGCVDGNRVVSWSLNALNNNDTLRLLAMVELACYKSRTLTTDPRLHTKIRRRIERVIREDRRKRHKRRKDQDAMVDAFAKHSLSEPPREASMEES
ncbi:hypothetical protein GLOTRDRAFT_52839 [Gloeophyllum trabeum ATCC 11539]|uniref:Uncharacterized protein n=1 Tax=Gloeophyllum trabeum (strain ATCC 11539 / FP-39264 / Madison 617) TaxID=670483 RepID=S7S3Z2_GLOTA|nr:uncharacterized protein GLOTRDRAFT_52839 [Gloeophyllum trabeum ATCC 11539]EPQ60554.1 hypothetical protein GLOTRDRAFT_52839 [Gloeophyllum trabeum ATCC 11539]